MKTNGTKIENRYHFYTLCQEYIELSFVKTVVNNLTAQQVQRAMYEFEVRRCEYIDLQDLIIQIFVKG